MITALLVGLAGTTGALLRYGTDAGIEAYHARRRQTPQRDVPFPAGTLIANAVGSLIIGLCWGTLREAQLDIGQYNILAVGLAGGLTTFSTLSVAAVTLWRDGRVGAAVVHVAGNLVLGLGAAWLGLRLVGAL
ncbi:CrcB protein [Arthrobacter pigmenti]|uniref:Fluoride-specific ion channel FluC n=1 Tax=Arthrobacter pigmenti TaxID=271432 RepID=A0A846RQN2_9MICC|nr:CrcB family protein [Arthrobacter pigmenti]NJC22882.1 CrcB protein [Arthrobacter pigmenti]